QGRQVQSAYEPHLALELDAELLRRAAAGLGHQRKSVGRPRLAGVLDEVRVPRRDLRAADPVTLEPARLEHPASRELVLGVLEDGPERALVGRLSRLSLRLHVADGPLDLLLRTRFEPELDARHDFALAQPRAAVFQSELGRRPPVRARPGDDQRALDDPLPVAAVRPRVPLDAPAAGPG